MTTSSPPEKGRGPKLSSAEAQARLADALRDNLRRRKAQIRARDAKAATAGEGQDPDDPPPIHPPGKSR